MPRQAKSVGFSILPEDMERLDRLVKRFGDGSRSTFLRRALDALETRARVEDMQEYLLNEKVAGRLIPPLGDGEETAERPRRKLASLEYDMMYECGILGREERTELLEGEIYVMTPHGRSHIHSVYKVQKLLDAYFGTGHVVYSQAALPGGVWSQVEPDVTVAEGDWETFEAVGAGRPVLVVEVSDSTKNTDQRVKDRLYANEGIPEYWIVNLVDLLLEVRRAPEGTGDHARYTRVALLGLPEEVAPLAHPDRPIAVRDLFPGGR